MALGMSHSRLRKQEVLNLAARITGQHYRRGQYAEAISNLTKLIEAAK